MPGLGEFLQETNLPAVTKIKNSATCMLSMMWLVVLLGATCFFGYHTYTLVSRYLQYHTQTTISLKFNSSLDFPGVTICNLNPVKKSDIECDQNYKNMIKLDHIMPEVTMHDILGGEFWDKAEIFNESQWSCNGAAAKFTREFELEPYKTEIEMITGWAKREKREITEEEKDMMSQSWSLNRVKREGAKDPLAECHLTSTCDADALQTQYASTYSTFSNQSGTDMWNQWSKFNKMKSSGLTLYESLIQSTSNNDMSNIRDLLYINKELLQNATQHGEEFIIECTFDHVNCNAGMFVPSYSKSYGNCYTFNSGLTTGVVVNTTRWGSRSGLALTLNIQRDEYIGLLAAAYGARMAIHDPWIIPIPEDQGFNIAPGMLTEISMKYGEIKRLTTPYESNCTMEWLDDKFLKWGMVDNKLRYSISYCRTVCKDAHLWRKCKCVLDISWHGSDRRCNFFNATHRACLQEQVENLANLQCDCPSPCYETRYKPVITQAKWPSRQYERLKINQFMGKGSRMARLLLKAEANKHEKPDYRKFSEQNLVRVKVFYEDQTYEVILEEVGYPMANLIADMGGIIGLYLGLSVIHLFEIAELILAVCSSGKKMKGNKTNQISENDQEINSTKEAESPDSIETAKRSDFDEKITMPRVY